MEGLLKVPGERRQLIDLLLKLPNMGNAAARRLLVASLPRALQDAIPAADAAGQHIANIVDTVNNDPYVQLADGSWPVMIVIEDAMYMVRGTTLENDLKALL